MSEDRAAKRFDATPSRKQRAMRDGNVARSSETTGIVTLAAASLASFALVPLVGGGAGAALRAAAHAPDPTRVSPALVAIVVFAFAPALAAACAAVAVALAQGGGLRVRLPAPNLTHLSPATGLKRMLGGEAAVGALRAGAAFAIVSAALVPLGREIVVRSASLSGNAAIAAFAESAMQQAMWIAIAVGALFAGADYALARRRWLRGLRMSLDELKRDHKENDGDPQARSRRSALHRSIVRGSISRTKEASFVVVNPTHIAIAIRYAPPEVPVPEILVRAADDAALAVKHIASDHAIPIIENVPLARALFASGNAGRPIPTQTYVAVAQVIAELARAGVLA